MINYRRIHVFAGSWKLFLEWQTIHKIMLKSPYGYPARIIINACHHPTH